MKMETQKYYASYAGLETDEEAYNKVVSGEWDIIRFKAYTSKVAEDAVESYDN